MELLRLPAALYAGATRLRGWAYDRRLFPILRVDVPVVSVGNLSVGGTGKTPMVAHLVEYFQARGIRVGVLSRGYGAKHGVPGDPQAAKLNDEGRMLQERFPDLLQVQDSDRVRGAVRLMDDGVQVIVLDDGFQHRRLHRDLDLVLVDASRPFGLPAIGPAQQPVQAHLPRGFLREGLKGLRRASLLVLTRTDHLSQAELQGLIDQLRGHAPGIAIACTQHAVAGLWQDPGQVQAKEHLRGLEVELISGIGNPRALEHSAESVGMRIRAHRIFPDHHDYKALDLQGLGDCPVVTTAKDQPKLRAVWPSGLERPWVLDVKLAWQAEDGGESKLADMLAALPSVAAKESPADLHN